MKPKWMSNEQWAEYRMTEEYKQEVCGVSIDEPPEDDDY
jgi:hypothetical protein